MPMPIQPKLIIEGSHDIGSTINVVIFNPSNAEWSNLRWYGAPIISQLDSVDIDEFELIGQLNKTTLLLSTIFPAFLKCSIEKNDGDLILSDLFLINNNSTKTMDNLNKLSEDIPLIGNGIRYDMPISRESGSSSPSNIVSRINQSYNIILGTAQGEIPMLPNIGNSLYLDRLFGYIDDLELLTISEEIMEILNTQEPRATCKKVDCTFNYETNYLSANVIYIIKNTNIQGGYIYNTKVGGDIND